MRGNIFRKSLIFVIIFLLLGTSFLPSISSNKSNIQISQPVDLLVPEDYPSIQAAVNYALEHQSTVFKINVSDVNSPYNENVLISGLSVALYLTRRNETSHPVINANGSRYCIKIENASNVNVSWFNLTNSGNEKTDAGIYVYESTKCVVYHNIFYNNKKHGVYISGWKSNKVNIANNEIEKCFIGIEIEESNCGSNISMNNISNCTYGISLFLTVTSKHPNANDVNINYNEIYKCNTSGLLLYDIDPSKVTIEYNYINNNSNNIQYLQTGLEIKKRLLVIEKNNIEYPDKNAIFVVLGRVNAAHNYWGTYKYGPLYGPAKFKFFYLWLGIVWPFPWSDQPWPYRR